MNKRGQVEENVAAKRLALIILILTIIIVFILAIRGIFTKLLGVE